MSYLNVSVSKRWSRHARSVHANSAEFFWYVCILEHLITGHCNWAFNNQFSIFFSQAQCNNVKLLSAVIIYNHHHVQVTNPRSILLFSGLVCVHNECDSRKLGLHFHIQGKPQQCSLDCTLFSPSLPLSLLLFSQVTGLSVSPGKDQLVVFHTKDNRDLIVCLQGMVPAGESRIGELVGTLLSHFKRYLFGQSRCSLAHVSASQPLYTAVASSHAHSYWYAAHWSELWFMRFTEKYYKCHSVYWDRD